MNLDRFSLKAIACLSVAEDTAEHYRQTQIQLPHIVIGLLVSGSEAGQLLQSQGLTLENLDSISLGSHSPTSSKASNEQIITVSQEVVNLLKHASDLATTSKSPLVTSMHLLAAILEVNALPNCLTERKEKILTAAQPLMANTWLREPGLIGPEFTREEALRHLVNWAKTDSNWKNNIYTFAKSSGISESEIESELSTTTLI